MLTNGKLTSGKRSMPRRDIDTTPSTMKLMMTIVAKTGRLIDVSEIHMAFGSRLAALDDWLHACVGRQLAAGVRNHVIALAEARDDLHLLPVGQAFDDRLRHDLLTLDLEHDALTVARDNGFAW